MDAEPIDSEPTGENPPVTVFLVDDHTVVRTGLKAFLDTEPGMAVVGEAAEGREALARIGALAAQGRAPDVVLMDMQMPHMDVVALR